ncbi:hypothetical protein MESMUL_22890 [Mesosutterella multiformis]|uniref:Uncharacterized protein n=1 Tax=Mesosutterella multiformis TaxID=2259133 RepID=A0A388SFH2_9BURK|nr:hypothetical protein MESMUL_22890 [Mesosutterella multiformis]
MIRISRRILQAKRSLLKWRLTNENSDSSVEDASDREVRDILTKEQMLELLLQLGSIPTRTRSDARD